MNILEQHLQELIASEARIENELESTETETDKYILTNKLEQIKGIITNITKSLNK
jgi:DNA-binding FrmR family transcriptional regulator